MVDYFTGSNFSININSNLVILMMPQPQNPNFWSRRLQIFQIFCRKTLTTLIMQKYRQRVVIAVNCPIFPLIRLVWGSKFDPTISLLLSIYTSMDTFVSETSLSVTCKAISWHYEIITTISISLGKYMMALINHSSHLQQKVVLLALSLNRFCTLL